MTIYEARELIKNRKISPKELVKICTGKIDAYESTVGAFITLCDDFLEKDGVLKGIPIAIKDNICTKNIVTSAGSRMLENFVPPYDATVTQRIKAAGGIVIGKTNMDEFGMGNDTQSSAFKKTSNPVNFDFVPGGSSGGSAAAVRCGMALGALGSDTGGSVRQPAAFCGVYGLRPTYSLISRYGLIAYASSMDAVGIMGNSVKDIAIMTDVIAGGDEKDATSAVRDKESYEKNLKPCIKGLKIGVIEEFFKDVDEDVNICIQEEIKKLKLLGAETEECSLESVKYAVSAYYIIASAEASSNLARYDGVRYTKRCDEYKSLEEMYIKTRSENFGEEVKKRILLGTFALSKGYYDLYYLKAKSAAEMIKREFERLFEKYDLLITPVSPVRVWKKDEKTDVGKKYGKDMCTVAVSLAGLPALSVPAGSDKNNMPVGMQVIGNYFEEQKILNFAYCREEEQGGI